MNGMQAIFRFLMAVVFAGFALPASAAPEKIFSLNMAPATATASASATLTATFKNETPNGNSTINSMILAAPVGLTITAASGPNGTVVVAPGGASVRVSNMSGLRPRDSYVLSVTVSIPASPGCTTYTWSGQAFTGNSFGGDAFRLLPAPTSQLTTSVTSGCALRFVPGRAPQDAIKDAIITSVDSSPAGPPVQVELWDGSARVTTFSGLVTLAKAAGSGTGSVAGATATAASGVATFSALAINATGVYSLVASSPGTVSSAPSPAFTIFDGELFCGDALGLQFTNPGGVAFGLPGFADGVRGLHNKDGSTCVKVSYDFTNNILASNTVSLIWDTGTQPNAAFSYTATWKDEDADPLTGLPFANRRTRVAFQFDGFGAPIYSFGVACMSASLPAPYGTLSTAINNVQTSITVSAGATPPVPFPAAIGTERIQVTNVAGSTWTVTRGTGNMGSDAAAHAAGAAVMSTPLPIDPNATLADGSTPNPFQGKQVPICVWDEGWVAAGPGKVRFTTSVFDVGDGFINRDF